MLYAMWKKPANSSEEWFTRQKWKNHRPAWFWSSPWYQLVPVIYSSCCFSFHSGNWIIPASFCGSHWDGCQQSLPLLYTQITSSVKWGIFPIPWIYTDLITCSDQKNAAEMITYQFQSQVLRHLEASTYTLLRSSYQVKILSLDYLMVKWTEGGPASSQPFHQLLLRHHSGEWSPLGCSSLS